MSWTRWSKLITQPKETGPKVLSSVGSKLNYRDNAKLAAPNLIWYRHVDELANVAQAVLDGTEKRVIICIPPGTSKSEIFSRLLPSAYLNTYPDREVGLVSYGASLAEDLAGDAREYFLAAGGKLDPSTTAKGDWRTLQGGGMWAKGFGGPIRGRRFHLGIIDDPHKGPEDLESELQREKFQKWFRRTWLNRQNLYFKEGASIVIVAQRLADNDLIGWLLEQPDAGQWTVVCYDAERSEEPWQAVNDKGDEIGPIPSRCKMWPDWRQPGELLCPELLSRDRLKEQQGDEDAYLAQFMQRPRPGSGTLIDPSKFIRVRPSDLPAMYWKVMGVDLAIKKGDQNDYTVGMPLGYGMNGGYYLFRPYRDKAEAPDTALAIPARARATGCLAIGVESVAFQASFAQYLQRDISLVGISVIEIEADMDKIARLYGWRPLLNQGLIYLVEDPEWEALTGEDWIETYLAEAKSFPRKKKDQIDATGLAIETARQLGLGHAPLVAGKHPGAGFVAA